jgi:hypothetical protein
MIYLMIMEVCGLIDYGVSGDRLQVTGKKRKLNNVTCNAPSVSCNNIFFHPYTLDPVP